ncbi:pentapeptide repeat-containing protein [Bifidobacterium adolescentis]|nr:pentapeptide repeat-containing protein [Bifidobacterium adolescentis]MDB0603630.1 pentapeptide repeat-containing protein [Bifidobacterium adolescentis]MDB0619070.1 pentapeptide repeat-containing protein [Bifidobacterium adolescentis]
MKITTPNGTLEGDNIEAILKEHGFDCLHGADLSDADLSDANLRYADLSDANLSDANLRGVNLRCADLRDADLSDANLRYADLRYANLCDANLKGADLRDAVLSDANLSDANLSDAYDVKLIIAKTSILPDEGDIIGWKKAWTDNEMPLTPVIVKLLIPSDALRSNATGRKCRASKARVLDLQDKQGNSLPSDTTAYSSYAADFTYKKGETIHVEDFDTNRWNECAPGIHFFITRIEAAEY